MNLAIFDIDGTLTRTNEVDAQCYVRAVKEELGIDATGLDWHDYTFVTDSGITREMFQANFGRLPSDTEVDRVRRRLVLLLHEAHRSAATAFTPVDGAADILGWLPQQRNWAVAIATGCWEASAQMKLRAAGISIDGLPAAFCEDGHAREDIVGAAIERAQRASGVERFERVVSIGDGVWDVVAAARLALAFVGVAIDGGELRLRSRGATHVVRDYLDREEILRNLREAGVPSTETAVAGS